MREPDFERANSRLKEGLKTCRAVVDDYRAMLAGDQGDGREIGAGAPTGRSDSEGGEGRWDEPGDPRPLG